MSTLMNTIELNNSSTYQVINAQQDFYNTSRITKSKYIYHSYYRVFTSERRLRQAEDEMFEKVNSPFEDLMINIGPYTYIHTRFFKCQNQTNNKLPLVLIHGFGAGMGFFVKNFDSLCANRDVYAIDLLGFARSSRPSFSYNPEEIIEQYVTSIEDWRAAININSFILLGHSFGGYLATWYTIANPDYVKYLILAEPWGYPERSLNGMHRFRGEDHRISRSKIKIAEYVLKISNPLTFVRWSFGSVIPLFRKYRQDLISLYDEKTGYEAIAYYFYHSNCQYPSGEIAFKRLHIPFGWSLIPIMPDNIQNLRAELKIDFIYGSNSWMPSDTGNKVKDMLPNSIVNINIIEGASHHLYATANEFNKIINGLCMNADKDYYGDVK